MKRLLRAVWFKVLTLVLCCGLSGAAVATGLWSAMLLANSQVTLPSIYGVPEELWELQQAEAYVQNALCLYVFSQHAEDLTETGQTVYRDLQTQLSNSQTNFRYELWDEQGRVNLDNLDEISLQEMNAHIETSQMSLEQTGYFYWTSVTPAGEEVAAEAIEEGGYYLNSEFFTDREGNPVKSSQAEAQQEVTIRWGIDQTFPVQDFFYDYANEGPVIRHRLQWLLPVTALCGLLAVVLGLGFLWSCGHKRGQETIYLCPLHQLPYELLLVGEAVVLAVVGQCFWMGRVLLPQDADGQTMLLPLLAYAGCVSGSLMLLSAPLASSFLTQIKARELWKRSLIGRCCRLLWGQTVRTVQGMGLFWKACIGVCGYLAVYGLLCLLSIPTSGLSLLLALALGLAGLAGLVWWLLGWRRVQEATEHIAGGDLNYHIDTDHLPFDLAQQAQHLNQISAGMEKAVAQKMKSDRFRTELITNVSHDLKTPLTSIISYVDLLKKLHLTQQPAADYIDVLDRKSQRLKALTEDLVEASKAATGVLSVSLERLEVVQLVQQSLGEYEERLEQVPLQLRAQLLQEPTWIRADGRHLWRVLDNLLGNCVKYALPGTRVYLDMEDTGERVVIALKNISADPLNIPPEELLERFVRGDSSRTTEGSGLGLSIAQSLCDLQGGTFALETDGDLFKVTLSFPKAP